MNYCKTTRHQGFTIVELLIVIVIIGILAAISIVSYNGVQQRAKNGAIISVASQSIKAIGAYIATTGTYPSSVDACITVRSGCASSGVIFGENLEFEGAMRSVAVLPKETSRLTGSDRYGVTYSYAATRNIDGRSQPGAILYYLKGVNQSCGMSGVLSDYYGVSMATSEYTAGNSGGTGKTACVITISGPSH